MNHPHLSAQRSHELAASVEFASRLWGRLAVGLWLGWAGLFSVALALGLRLH